MKGKKAASYATKAPPAPAPKKGAKMTAGAGSGVGRLQKIGKKAK